ncbi:hypothetical protein ScPMuIL_014624 [Solemya velum]
MLQFITNKQIVQIKPEYALSVLYRWELGNLKIRGANGTSCQPKKTLRFSDEVEEFDGLLSQDREELSERVSYLEKKVRQQEDEVICLKSALADVIRRLGQVEADRVQNNILPSKPLFRTPKRSERKSHLSALDNVNVVPHRSATPPVGRSMSSPRSSTSTPIKKWSSLSNSTDLHNANITPAKRSTSQSSLTSRGFPKGSRDPQWNEEDGYMKIYMRGRAVNLHAPSDLEDYDFNKVGSAPEEELRLDWVYGYRGRDCRNNLFYLPTGEIIYFTAAVVILQNTETKTQRHYMGHTDDVKCLSIHPDKVRIATGQVAGHEKKDGKPHVRIWDSMSLNTLHVIGIGDFDRAVCCVSFSKMDGGEHLVVVDDANEHIISVWDLSKDKPSKVTETKSSTEPVLVAEFHPSEVNSIVTCGKNQISFWTIEGGTLSKKMGIFDKHDKPKFVLCLTFTESGEILTGDSNGNIYLWEKGNNRIQQAVTGTHEGGVFSLCLTKDGHILSGGGKDRKIIEYDESLQRTGQDAEIPEAYGAVRILSQGNGSTILVGTTRNCILLATSSLHLSPIVEGHTDELWGLACHPTQNQFATCASDKKIYLWDSMSHRSIWVKDLDEPAHSCSFHPDGSFIAVGTHTGKWYVIDSSTREVIYEHHDGNEQIECVQYSPDGTYLALGSRDNYVYVYQVPEEGQHYTRKGRCSGHSSFITHVDWSSDGQFLRTNSGDYEVLFWNGSNCKQITSPASLRDIKWATQNCTLAFNSAGIWPEGADGTDVNSCCRSHKKTLVASADDFGKVNLFKYPCHQPKANCHTYGGHSSHVTNVTFLQEDSRLISVGGRDMSICQWEVIL